MRDDPDFSAYKARWADLYSDLYDGGSVAGMVLRKSHEIAEAPFGPDRPFPVVLEVGAGDARHLSFVRHQFETYFLTDLEEPGYLAPSSGEARGEVRTQAEDAAHLSFADESVDRLIASHVLEHMLEPHKVLREWHRVLRPGGVLTLVLPCDPGITWRIGRALGSRGKFEAAGIDYDYWMAREHVNPIGNLLSLIRYYFPDRDERWYPFRIPSPDLNLIYTAHIWKAA